MEWELCKKTGDIEAAITKAEQVDVTSESSNFTSLELKDRYGHRFFRITAGQYGNNLNFWTPKEVKKEEE